VGPVVTAAVHVAWSHPAPVRPLRPAVDAMGPASQRGRAAGGWWPSIRRAIRL